ncbi:phage antirepressor KilAC domain-containing protein [Clostridium haemolyticum]|uniref:Antirepressor n=1 Tax=Clostridium haemolyticum NCTC 9693 TaxID=1443114 RepID=A0ABR4TAM0_CLOHA|nr:phage antirepressor KilAC domain-containing protein [Clostridium haemolyticum]KEI14018.1 antirepressor [Clostridium haemolyticum NCTC 9693]
MENKQIQIFKNNLFEVAVKLDNEEMIFDAERVAKCLGIGERKNDKFYVKWKRINKYLGKNVSTQVAKGDYIPESAVYKLAFKANNDVAEQFQDWLAVDVIPSIRKHGAYMTENVIEEILTNPDTIIKLATTLKEEKQKRKLAEQQLEEAKPKINFAEKIEFTKASISMKKFADLMNIKNFGRNKLLQWLRNKEYLNKSNQPYRQYIERDLFEIKERVVDLGFKGEKIQTTTYVTGKGQTYLYNKIMQDINIRA